MPYRDGSPTLGEQIEDDYRFREDTRDILKEAYELRDETKRLHAKLARVEKFLLAYWTGDALTFVNPDNGELVSATYEAQALAAACLRGPMTVGDEDDE